MKTISLGSVIAKRRKIMLLTQTELANKMGVTAQAVSKWERNQSCPDINTFAKLADILGLSSDELLSLKDNKNIFITKSANNIVGSILCAVAILMTVAAVVTYLLNIVDNHTSFNMFILGGFCSGLCLLRKK